MGSSVQLTAPDGARWARRNLQPPSDLLIVADDLLIIRAIAVTAGTTVSVAGRILSKEGQVHPFAQSCRVATALTQTTFTLSLPEGFLLAVAVNFVQGTLPPASFYVTVGIGRGPAANPTIQQVLVADYVTFHNSPSWPPRQLVPPGSGPGRIDTIQVANPAAGVDWATQVPSNCRWRVQAIRCRLVTSGVAGNRVPVLRTNAVSSALLAPARQVQAAATTFDYTWLPAGASHPAIAGAASSYAIQQICSPFFLGASENLGVTTDGLDGGDQWSSIFVHYEEWLAVQ